MKIFVITSEMQESQIHRISVQEGKYLKPSRVNGSMLERGDIIVSHILNERPNKVIIEEVAFGKGVLDSVTSKLNYFGFSFDKDGTVNYK